MEVINIVKDNTVRQQSEKIRSESVKKELSMTKTNKSLIKTKKKPIDLGLLITIFILLALGLIIVLSASAPSALSTYGDSYYFFRKQLISAVIGIGAMFVFSFIDYRIYKGKLANIAIVVSIILLALVLVPRCGNNNKRIHKMDKPWFSISTIRNYENSADSIFSR